VDKAEEGGLRLYLDYSAVTDDTGTKGGALGHTIYINPEYVAPNPGRFGAAVWLEALDANRLDEAEARGGGDVREVDYFLYYAQDVKPLDATAEVGWIAATFPQRHGDRAYTHEWYVALGLNDAAWFRTKENIFNPYLVYYMDVDDTRGGRIQFQISHTFLPARMGLARAPVWKNVAITPSFLMDVDLRGLTKHTKIASLRYGIEVFYDLSDIFKIPPKHGSIGVTVFLYFRDCLLGDPYEDRLFGGMTLSYRR